MTLEYLTGSQEVVGSYPLFSISNSGAMTLQKMTGAGLTIIGWLIIEQIWKRKKHITKAIPNKGFSGNLNDITRSENK